MANYTGLRLPDDLLRANAPPITLAVQSRASFAEQFASLTKDPPAPISRVRTISGANCRTRQAFADSLSEAFRDLLPKGFGWASWDGIPDYLQEILARKSGCEVLAFVDGEQLFADEITELSPFVHTLRWVANQSRNRPYLEWMGFLDEVERYENNPSVPSQAELDERDLSGPPLRCLIHISPESTDAILRFLLAGIDQDCPPIRLVIRDFLSATINDAVTAKIVDGRAHDRSVALPWELGLPADLLREDAPVLVLAVQSRENFETEWSTAAASPIPPMSRVRTINGVECRTLVGLAAELNRAYSDSLDESRGERITPHWSSIDEYLPELVLEDQEGFEVLAIVDGDQILAEEPEQLFHFVDRMRYIALDTRTYRARQGRTIPSGPSLRCVIHIPPRRGCECRSVPPCGSR